jgi:hypothetical protein
MRNTSALASSPHGTPRARSSVGASTATHAKDSTGIHLRSANGSVATAARAAQSAPSAPSRTSSSATRSSAAVRQKSATREDCHRSLALPSAPRMR